MFELSVWWSQPVTALTFQTFLSVQSNECVSTDNIMYTTTNWALQMHMGSVMALWTELLNPFFSPFSEVSCLNRWNTGGNAILKTHCSMDHMGQDDCIFTYVESTRWGRIHKSSPNVRLALQTSQCKLHLMMQKEILDDLLTPREDQTGNTSL